MIFSIGSHEIRISIAFFIFSVSSIYTHDSIAYIVSGIWLSICGIFDHFFRNTKAELAKRSIPLYKPNIIFTDFNSTGDPYFPIVIKKFKYCGFSFNIMGDKQIPLVSLGLSKPLCPTCNGNLIVFSRVIFPAYISIRFNCNGCNAFYKSKLTKEELIKHVADIHNIKSE